MPELELRRALRRGRVLPARERAAYARDCWPAALAWPEPSLEARSPALVALPRDEEEVAAALAWSRRHGVPVVPWGAGSGVVGAAVCPREGALALDLGGLRETFELIDDPANPRVRAGAGWLGAALEARLNDSGWSLLHFPASLAVSTPGGWIALDSYGQLSTRHGGVGRQALSVRAVLPGGEAREEAAAAHLGAEGTLGVLSEVTLRIRRAPSSRRYAAAAFPDAESALAFARAALVADPPPSVLRAYSPVDALLTGLGRRARSGESGAWKARLETWLLRRAAWLERLRPLAGRAWTVVAVYEDEGGGPGAPPPWPADARPLGEGPARAWWARRYHWSRERLRAVFAGGCFADTADLWADWDRLAALEREVLRALAPAAFAFSHFSHFDRGGACLYVTFAGAGGPQAHARAWRAALDACVRAGGRVNHHHGIGLAKLPWLENAAAPGRLELWRREKLARDPQRLLNPGKLGL